MDYSKRLVQVASFVLLLVGCAGQMSVQTDGGAGGDSGWQPISHSPDLGMQGPDGLLQSDAEAMPPQTPDQGLPAHAPDMTSSCVPTSCLSSCGSGGVSSKCSWKCGGVTYSVSCSGTQGCSQYSTCSCYTDNALMKSGPYSTSAAGIGINGALAGVMKEFCKFQ